MVDGTAVFFTNHWLLDLYAIIEGNTAEERTPVGSLLSNSNVLIVGSVASWSGKSFVQRTSYIDYVSDDLSCLPRPSKAYYFDEDASFEWINSLSGGLNKLTYNFYNSGNEMVSVNLASYITLKSDLAVSTGEVLAHYQPADY